MKKILIAFGTRYGATEEISRKIADILEKSEINIDLINLKNFDENKLTNLADYDGIIIGSSIKIGQWTKSAKKFIELNQTILKQKNKPLAVFVTSATAMKVDDIPKTKKEYIEDFLYPMEIKPDLYDAFAGVIDFTKDSKIGFLGKKALKMVMKNDPNVDFRGRNDFRDWNQIDKFAQNYLKLL